MTAPPCPVRSAAVLPVYVPGSPCERLGRAKSGIDGSTGVKLIDDSCCRRHRQCVDRAVAAIQGRRDLAVPLPSPSPLPSWLTDATNGLSDDPGRLLRVRSAVVPSVYVPVAVNGRWSCRPGDRRVITGVNPIDDSAAARLPSVCRQGLSRHPRNRRDSPSSPRPVATPVPLIGCTNGLSDDGQATCSRQVGRRAVGIRPGRRNGRVEPVAIVALVGLT